MLYYREQFLLAQFPHATVLPKMHMLEEHAVPWLKKWHVGFGLLGEQGVESIHKHFNTLGKTHSNISEEVSYLLQEHYLHIAPTHIEKEIQEKAAEYNSLTNGC